MAKEISIRVVLAGLELMSALIAGVIVFIFLVIALLAAVVHFGKKLEERDRQSANDKKDE